jgi:uncharacterized GH25 family protein
MNLQARLLLSIALLLPCAAQAHKPWLAPSKTVLNVGQWITVDAGVSTDPFVKDHNPGRVDNLVITAPDGSVVSPENVATGKLRSVFDLQLQQAGTYRIAIVNSGITAIWDDGGQRQMWPPRGQVFSAEGFAKEVPKEAKDLRVTQSLSRLETFATAGKPSDGALKATGKGLELQPITAVNDLYVGEPAKFRLLLDDKPAAGVVIEAIADGVRYRNSAQEIETKTGADGVFSLEWPQPGLYWISASVQDEKAEKPAKQRRISYTATLEVLSP